MSQTLPVNNIVEVTLVLTNASEIGSRNVNDIALFTTESATNSESYGIYTNANAVAKNYGSDITYKQAKSIFSQETTISTGKGRLIIIPLEDGNEALATAITRAIDNGFPFFHGILTNATLTDQQIKDVAILINGTRKMFYYGLIDRAKNNAGGVIEYIQTNLYPETKLILAPGYTLLDDAHILTAGIISRLHSSDFESGGRVATTLHLKKIKGVNTVTGTSQSDIDRSKITGAICVQSFENGLTTRVFESSANEYSDTVYNQHWLGNYIEDKLSTKLANQTTKIGQTDSDLTVLHNELIKCLELAVVANVGGKGINWNSDVPFGDPETFTSHIYKYGFYASIQSVNSQTQEERETRVAPLEQFALAFSGAVHKMGIVGVIQR